MSLSHSSLASTDLAWERPEPALARGSTAPDQQALSSHAGINVRGNERLLSALAGGFVVAWGLSHPAASGKLAALLGSALVYRGVSGHCHVYQALGIDRVHDADDAPEAKTGRERAATSYEMLRTVTVQRPAEAVYRAWSKAETFAQAMGHFASHTALDATRTRWTLRDPLGHEHSWDTEVALDEPAKRIRWQSVEGAPLFKNLTLELKPAPGNRGTEMTLHLRLTPPSGVLGVLLKKLFGGKPAWVLDRALGNVKSLLEAGEVASLDNNPSARASAHS